MEVTEGAFPDMANNIEGRQQLAKWAEVWLRVDALLHRATELFGEWKTKMAHWNDERGPEDYEKNERDLRDLLASAVREGARRANVQFGSYNDGGGSWSKWIVPGLVTLGVMGVGGGILMFGKLSAIEANQINQGQQIAELRSQMNELRQHVRASP